jgi:hypothetical protein
MENHRVLGDFVLGRITHHYVLGKKSGAYCLADGRKKLPLQKAAATTALELGVGVRANFAVEVDLFVFRGGPFHGRSSFWSERNSNS